jgi:hypothetical protein
MTLKQPTPAPDDPRLKGHETDYSASRGGWVKPTPVPKEDRSARR